jgi:hypothetical protein
MAAPAHMQDDENTAFPATEATPGQAESRMARKRFMALAEAKDKDGRPACPWMEDYFSLRAEGWDWRRAAYIAWAASPMDGRWPANQQKLALEVLGLKSDRTIRTWREKDPKIDERVARLQVEPLMQHRRDVITALISSAKMLGREGTADRKTYLTLTGDLNPKKKAGEQEAAGQPTSQYEGMSEEELKQVIRNLQSALDEDDDADE